jgi:hypothetical protein
MQYRIETKFVFTPRVGTITYYTGSRTVIFGNLCDVTKPESLHELIGCLEQIATEMEKPYEEDTNE